MGNGRISFPVFCSLSAGIAVFENILFFWLDMEEDDRKKTSFGSVFYFLCPIPWVSGINLRSEFQPLGLGSNGVVLRGFSGFQRLAFPVHLLSSCQPEGLGLGEAPHRDQPGQELKLPGTVWIFGTCIFSGTTLFAFGIGCGVKSAGRADNL